MEIELPTQGQIVEELADRAAAQIDLGKPVAFDNALQELVRYHRFLLGLGASTTPDGAAFNYAELGGSWLRPPHEQWLGQYARLFDRAANKIAEDDHFLVALAYAQGQLLQLPENLPASASLTEAVLDLWPSLLFSLERWANRRAIIQTPINAELGERTGDHSLILSPADAAAHAATLRRLLGAWEGLFHAAPAIADVGEKQGRTVEMLWESAGKAWSFIWPHLVGSARAVTISVWNKDEEGAALFADALLQWSENLSYRLTQPHFLELPEFLYPDLLALPWEEAKEKAALLSYRHGESIDPIGLLTGVVAAAQRDVCAITASLLIHWSVSGKLNGDLATRTARALLVGGGGEWHHARDDDILLQLLRRQLAGERYQDGRYGAELDTLVRRLDNLSEKPQVSGRVYTPSTLSDRQGLIEADAVILAVLAGQRDRAASSRRILELAAEENRLPGGDAALRQIVADLDRYAEAATIFAPHLIETAARLGSETPEADFHQLGDFLKSAREELKAYRAGRLAERAVAPEALEARRRAVEAALLDPTQHRFFEAATIETSDDPAQGELCTFRTQTSKGRLVEPQMESPPINELEVLAPQVASWAIGRAMGLVGTVDQIELEADVDPISPMFWEAIKAPAGDVGKSPRLLVHRRFRSALTAALLRPGTSPLADLKIEKVDVSRRQYLGRIEGVDVYLASGEEDIAWLISGEKLKRVIYSPVENDQRVTIRFVSASESLAAGEDEDMQDSDRLIFQFRQDFEWDDSPVFRIRFPLQREGDDGDA